MAGKVLVSRMKYWAPVLGATENPMVPLPAPDAPCVMVRNAWLLTAPHVQVLVVLVAEVAASQQLRVPLAEGVVQLGDHAGELTVRAVAPEEADRVEDVAEHAQLRQHHDPFHAFHATLAAERERLAPVVRDQLHRLREVQRAGIRMCRHAEHRMAAVDVVIGHAVAGAPKIEVIA